MALNTQNFSTVGALQGSRQTIVIAPQECHQHMTAPLPMVRGGPEPPPEQINRLHVLTDSGTDSPLGCVSCVPADTLLFFGSMAACLPLHGLSGQGVLPLQSTKSTQTHYIFLL